jgi:CheY-like chemotaxis protein
MNAGIRAQVLHVEDDSALQALVRATLVQHGAYDVYSAGDGVRALQLAAHLTPSLVLLDLNLPGMSGVEILKALQANEKLRRVPVVFLTASQDLVTHIELLALGAHAVVQKPFRPQQLLRALERALAHKEI